jgi:5-hydroxyisourate hydrolase
MTATLSTHVLDAERGVPASGVPVTLFIGPRELARAQTNHDGRVPLVCPLPLQPGTYRLAFEVGAYFVAGGRTLPFLERISIEFRVTDADTHVHLPLLLSPHACTTYRGS